MRKMLLKYIPILAFLFMIGCAPAVNAINELFGLSQRTLSTTYRLPSPGFPADSPPPWADLDLRGRLILVRYNPDGNQLIEFDLSTENTEVLFQASPNSLLAAADVSQDGSRIVLAYAPPSGDQLQLGYTDLYLMPSDGSIQPEPFLTRDYPDEAFYHPVWSPDGLYVYYTHLYRRDPDKALTDYRIERASLSGEFEAIVEEAIWPSISPDSGELAYLAVDPGTTANELYLIELAQKTTVPLITRDDAPTVDAHVFSPDGRGIYFSAANSLVTGSSWFEKMIGVEIAHAHNVASDWYFVAAGGGKMNRLTRINGTGLAGDFSPDGKYFVFYSAGGLFLMKPDGSDLLAMANANLVGNVTWLP